MEPKLRRPKSQKNIVAPPWIELPRDVTANILHRLGAIEILESAQKVCTTWRSVCRDPSKWRVIDMKNLGDLSGMPYNLEVMCRHAVDRSGGELIDINIEYFGTDQLLDYIAERSSNLRRLSFAHCYGISGIYEEQYGDEGGGLIKAVKKLPELEELHLIIMGNIGAEDIKAIGIAWPMLKSFTFNGIWYSSLYSNLHREGRDEVALAVAKNMPNLRHLRLIGNEVTNEGLEAILDGCRHLESLDLRRCLNLDLGGNLGKRCSCQIKCLRRPLDSTHDYGWFADDSSDSKYHSSGNYVWSFHDNYFGDSKYHSLGNCAGFFHDDYFDDSKYHSPGNDAWFFDDDYYFVDDD